MTLAFPPNRSSTPEFKLSLIGSTVRNRYFVEGRIGRGTFGTVYKVIDLDLPRRAGGYVRRAMKVIDVVDPNSPRLPPPDYVNYRLKQAVREIHYHKLVSSHPNIVTLHEHFFSANREVFLILDYCAGGDLKTYIIERGNPFARDDRRMRELFLQICGAVDFMHSRGVFHKDLKPHNILISQDGRKVFLCDFGLASDVHTNTRGGGSTSYMSPELLDNTGFYCPQRADTWTLGIIALNMLGLWPWDDASVRSKRFRSFMLGDDYLLRARPISPGAKKLIRDILRFHPELRLSVPQISARVLQLHSFFNNPRTKHTAAELWQLTSTYQPLIARPDPIARRRDELEYFRGLDGTLAFNDLSGRLPLPPPPPRIHAFNLLENPPLQANKPHCAPIRGIPPPVTIPSPEEAISLRSKQWIIENLKLTGGWCHP